MIIILIILTLIFIMQFMLLCNLKYIIEVLENESKKKS